MASTTDIAGEVRAHLRDFPQFFEVEEGPLTALTIRLPHPLVSSSSLQVYITDDAVDPPTTVITTSWQLDERNGLLKLTDASYLGKRVLIAGYHYVWFSDSDVARAVTSVGAEVLYTTPNKEITDLSQVEADLVEIGAVVHLLWSLTIELALDIDVSTPEGMFIPAHQRYQQVTSMMQYWENEFQTRAASLNLGLGALEIFKLRRVSYTTGRLVPMYQNREIDDPTWPDRLYPPIPEYVAQGQSTPDSVEVIDGVSISTRQRRYDGWYPVVSYPGYLGRGD